MLRKRESGMERNRLLRTKEEANKEKESDMETKPNIVRCGGRNK